LHAKGIVVGGMEHLNGIVLVPALVLLVCLLVLLHRNFFGKGLCNVNV